MPNDSAARIAFLTPHYRAFIKDQIEATAPQLESAVVLARNNPVARLAAMPGIRRFAGSRIKNTWHNAVDAQDLPANVAVLPLNVTYLRPDSRNPGLPRRLEKAARRCLARSGYEPNLVHGHFTHPHGAAAVRLARNLGVPSVVTAHGYDVYSLPFRSPRWRRQVEATVQAADAVITVSQRNRRLLVDDLGVDPERVRVIPNGYAPARFEVAIDRATARQRLGISPDATLLLTVGNLVSVKNQVSILEAMARLGPRPGVQAAIVGGGPLEEPLRARARALGIADHVRFVGAVPHDDVVVWMHAADLFLLPSLDEGNPTVLAEALACGLPTVASAVGGVPDVLGPEQGLLVAPGDVDGLVEQIGTALDRSWDTAAIRAHGRAFAWPELARAIAATYRWVLEENR